MRTHRSLPDLSLRFLLCALLIALSAGCTPHPSATDAGALAPIKSIRLSQTLELGDVAIVTGGYWSTDGFVNKQRTDEILQIVEARILQQRNISMKLKIVRKDIPSDEVMTGVAAGNPPQIMVRTYNDNPKKQIPGMLRLNEAIDTYGPGLMVRIPANGWDRCKIGDAIVAVPSVGLSLSPCLCINTDVLQANGWEEPATVNDLETLLGKAKAAGVRPFNGSIYNSFAAWFGLDDTAWGFVDTDAKVLPVSQSPEYEAWLEKMHAWYQAGYFQEPPADGDSNFLIDSVYWKSLAQYQRLQPMRWIALGKAQPLAQPPVQELYTFESYSKPEAVVTLLDWTYDNAQNHDLISKGVEGTDYKRMGDNGYELMSADPNKSNQWELQDLLAMDGFGDNPVRGCVNAKAVRQAATDQDAAVHPSSFARLPIVTERYALPGSALDQAWHPTLTDDDQMPPADAYIQGQITRSDYDQLRTEEAKKADPKLKLLKAWLNKTYDPLKDMYTPVTGPMATLPPPAEASPAP